MRTMKTTKILMMFSVAAIGLAAVGCDSTTTCADGGVCPDAGAGGSKGGSTGAAGAGGAAGGASGTLYAVTPGTYCFDITAGAATADGCGLDIPSYVGMRVPVTYVAATGQITVGTMGSLGTGLVSQNKGTLMRANSPFDPMMPTCTWTQTDTTMLELIAQNTFTASVTETQSTFAAACNPPPPSDPCTSTFTFTMAIHAPALMPDAATGLCP